jgi:RNA polymerase sigma-70 factor, ECF subfamily
VVVLSEREISAGIVEACRQGDRDAFRALYETYKDKVYSITLYFFHGDSSTAADATQQVFLKLLRNMAQFRGDSEFSTWLYRFVVNTCLDWTRRKSAREIPADLRPFAASYSQEQDFARAQTGESVQAALSALPPKFRMPVLLRYFEGLSYGEMGRALNCSTGTVASRLNRAHKILAKKLAGLKYV